MKIILFSILWLLSQMETAQNAQGLTLAQAKAAVDYFSKNRIQSIYLWCACCEGETPSLMSLKKLYYRETYQPGVYELMVSSKTKGVDDYDINLANLWVKEGGQAINLGRHLIPEIDSCAPPFPWGQPLKH